MFYQPSDAPAPSPDDLGPNPFASPESSSRAAQALAGDSPPGTPRPIYESDILPRPTPPRLAPLPKKNERRKLSDATRAPNPAFGYQGPLAMGKPGAGQGFQPINSLNGHAIVDRNNPAYGRSRHKTYAKADRPARAHAHAARSIGHEQHDGQREFLRRNPSHQTPTSYSHSPPRASPVKRRKTEHPTIGHQPSGPVYEIDASEDESQLAAPSTRLASTPRARSSRSPYSTTSKQSATKAKPSSQPRSEFKDTHDALQPRRLPKPRRKNASGVDENRRGYQMDASFLAAGELLRGHSVDFVDNEVEDLGPTRQSTPRAVERGVNHDSAGRNPLQQHSERVTSEHFPRNKMRINESTAEVHERIASNAHGAPHLTRNLRDYRAARDSAVEVQGDPFECSEDELAHSVPSPLKSWRSLTPYKPDHGSKGAANRTGAMSKRYQLDHARAYNLDPDCEQLTLEPTENPNNFRVTGQDRNGNHKTLKILNLASVNKVMTDDTHKMRLTGPVKDGDLYWFDLSFPVPKQFREFLDKHVSPEVADNARVCLAKEKMEELFKRPFDRNEKVRTNLMVRGDLPPSHAHLRQLNTTRQGLLAGLRRSSRTEDDSVEPSHKDPRKPPATTPAFARPTRSTRATAPVYDQPNNLKKVVKFSKDPGLGERWKTPLEFKFDEGFLKRRRCTVTFDDLPKLDEEEMLNDDLMNFYILYLYEHLKVSKDQVYFFNTYFFEALTKNTKGREAINYEAVKTWTKKDDIFSYDYIVVPINENWHWYLAIICNVSNIGRKLAIDEFENSQDPEQTATGIQTDKDTGEEDDGIKAEMQGATDDTVPATEGSLFKQAVDDGDVNLFEEEKKLNLIDREDEGADPQRQQTNKPDQSNRPQLHSGIPISALSSAQAEDRPSKLPLDHHKQPSKKKGRRKFSALRKDPAKPVIIVLDSLSQPHSNATRALREWLQAEGLQRRGMSVEMDNKGYYAKATQVPMQSNLSDCGLYVLGYAQQFFRDPDNFKKKLLTGEMSSKTDWPDMEPLKMRIDVRNVIFQLYKNQKEAHKSKKAARTKNSHTPPAKAEHETTSPIVQQSGSVEPDTSATLRANTVEDQLLNTSKAKDGTMPAAAQRLGSPLNSKAEIDRTDSNATMELGKDNTSNVNPDPKTPSIRSPAATSAQPKHTPKDRRASPEVRVPVRSPHIDTSSFVRYDYATNRSQRARQQLTDLTSPLQRPKLYGSDDEELRMPIAEKASANTLNRPTRARSGSYDDPITLDDWQDLDAINQRVPESRKEPSPGVMELERPQEMNIVAHRRAKAANYSSPARGKPRQQAIQHDDSLQDDIGSEWQEGRDVMRAKKLSMEDERRRLGQRVKSPPPSVHRSMEVVNEQTDRYSGSLHTVQAMDMNGSTQDHEVAETPERLRSSPGVVEDGMDWQAGSSLPV